MHETPTSPVAAPAGQHSRRGLLSKAVLTGIAAVPVIGALNRRSEAAPNPQQTLTPSSREAFTDILLHEEDHVARLSNALKGAGATPRPMPTFKNLTATSFDQFVAMSQVFENVGVGAYLGALGYISQTPYLALAGSIALVEARHAGFLNVFTGYDVTAQALTNVASAVDKPLTQSQVLNAVSPYVTSLNGGPGLSFSTSTKSAANDVAITQYALALEYLEREFYRINVPKYFQIQQG